MKYIGLATLGVSAALATASAVLAIYLHNESSSSTRFNNVVFCSAVTGWCWAWFCAEILKKVLKS